MLVPTYISIYVCSVVVDADVSGIPIYEGGSSHTDDLDTQKIQLEERPSQRERESIGPITHRQRLYRPGLVN